MERALLEPLKERADVSHRHHRPVGRAAAQGRGRQDARRTADRGKLAVTFLTFGFKHGTPRDADLTFDVRFLPNPHYEAELRELTGLDRRGGRLREHSDGIGEFYERLTPLLDYLLPAYEQEGKSHLTVGIGCTGGRHRSVVIAEHLARVYAERDDLPGGRRPPRRRQAAAPPLSGVDRLRPTPL